MAAHSFNARCSRFSVPKKDESPHDPDDSDLHIGPHVRQHAGDFSSGANRTLTIIPATGQTGSTTITVTVSDGSAATSTSFLVTVSGGASPGLVAAYSFNEGTGITAADSSGNGNTGSIQGATWSAQRHVWQRSEL